MPCYPPANAPTLDPRTGLVSREWLEFFRQVCVASSTGGGPTGPTGPTGPSGPSGPTGPTGPTGASGAGATPGGIDRDVQYNDMGTFGGRSLPTFGYWNLVTNGDPTAPEIIFDSFGDTVVAWNWTW